MPRRKPAKIIPPTMRAEAQKRYDDVYAAAFKGKEELYPQMKSALLELSRIEVQLEWVDVEIEKKQKNSSSPFLALESSKAPYIDPLLRLQKELRASHAKYLKLLNLAMDRQKVMKAETNSKLAGLAAKMR